MLSGTPGSFRLLVLRDLTNRSHIADQRSSTRALLVREVTYALAVYVIGCEGTIYATYRNRERDGYRVRLLDNLAELLLNLVVQTVQLLLDRLLALRRRLWGGQLI